jgi:hypothetical protein
VGNDKQQIAVPTIAALAQIFGEFRLETPDGTSLLLSNRRGMLIVALLCLQPDRSLDRETLCRLLWPDRFHAQAKASLRQCLLDLRHQFEHEGCRNPLIVSRAAVGLDRNLLTSDLSELEDVLAGGDALPLTNGWRSNGRRSKRGCDRALRGWSPDCVPQARCRPVPG